MSLESSVTRVQQSLERPCDCEQYSIASSATRLSFITRPGRIFSCCLAASCACRGNLKLPRRSERTASGASRKHAFQEMSRITVIDLAGRSYSHPLEAMQIRKISRRFCAPKSGATAPSPANSAQSFFSKPENASRTGDRECPAILAAGAPKQPFRAVARAPSERN